MKRSLCLLVTLLLCLHPAAINAEQSADSTTNPEPSATDTTPPLLAQARALSEKMTQARTTIELLKQERVDAKGDQYQALGRRIASRQIELLEDLKKLVASIEKLEAENINADELRQQAETLTERAGEAIMSLISDIEINSERDKAIDQHLSLDQLYRALDLQINASNTLGLNAGTEQTYLQHHLVARAERLSGNMELLNDRQRQLNTQLGNEPDNSELLQAQLELQQALAERTQSLSITIKLMTQYQLDASRYQRLLIQSTGDITADILNKKVLLGLIEDGLKNVVESVRENGANLLIKVLIFGAIVLLFKLLAMVVSKLVAKTVQRNNTLSALLREMIVSLSSRLVMIVGILMALSQVGISLGPVLAGLGIAGFIIGFALQDSLSNFASGMMILFYRPFDNGDFIEAAGVSGTVAGMSLVSTTILTFDNQTLVVPNSKIWGDVIRNITHQSIRRIDLEFHVGLEQDLTSIEQLLSSVLSQHSAVLEQPPSAVRLHRITDSAMLFIVRPWVKTEDYWPVYWDLTRAVKLAFDEAGIAIPHPQQDVHIITRDGEPSLRNQN